MINPEGFEWIEDVREETNKTGYLVYRLQGEGMIDYQSMNGFHLDPRHALIYPTLEMALKSARILDAFKQKIHFVTRREWAIHCCQNGLFDASSDRKIHDDPSRKF